MVFLIHIPSILIGSQYWLKIANVCAITILGVQELTNDIPAPPQEHIHWQVGATGGPSLAYRAQGRSPLWTGLLRICTSYLRSILIWQGTAAAPSHAHTDPHHLQRWSGGSTTILEHK